MGIINKIFGGEVKGYDCTDNEDGTRTCRAMVKHKNNKLATGSQWQIGLDKSCKSQILGNYSVFEEDSDLVSKSRKQMEADCRGGIN